MLGCIAWGNAAARRFLARKHGCFVGVSSVAGDRGRVGRPVYNASKAGMDCYLEALRNRLWRHGVQVTTIRPGFVETPMTAGLKLKGAIAADKAAELILRARDRVSLAINPFRPDTHPSASTGVAMITGADEAVAAHQRVAEASWREAVKGPAGGARLRQLINIIAPAV